VRRRAAIAIGLVLALSAGGAVEAKRTITPKAGGYIGKVTNANGRGSVQLIVATFTTDGPRKPRKGPKLFAWTAILKCDDGSTREEPGPSVFAPLKGATKFSGTATSGPETVTLKGRFTSNTKLKGTARVENADCDSGPVKFKAHRRN
jgi:hypothetical protein